MLYVHPVLNGLLNVGQGVLHASGEHMGDGPRLVGLGQRPRPLRRVQPALVLQGGDLHHLAAQGPAQPLQVDLVAVLPHQVDHVHRHHHRKAQLNELGGEVEVALDVGAVHNIQDGVRLLLHQIVPGHHLLQGVRGQGVDPRQILYDHVGAALEAALLLLHRHPGPVAHVLVGAGEGVEQRGFAAVGIARQGDLHIHLASLLSYCGPWRVRPSRPRY